MSKIGEFISRILFNLFPQREPTLQTQEQKTYEKGGHIFRGIKGNKDKSRIIEGMSKGNFGV